MKKGIELVIHKENYDIVRYNYYFLNKEEMENFKLKENERFIGDFVCADESFPYAKYVEVIRPIETKHIYDVDEYAPFIKNLQRTQYNFGYSSEWYNNWVDYVNKIPYDEACALIELLNEFYVAGMEKVL